MLGTKIPTCKLSFSGRKMTTELLSYKALRIGLQNSRSQAYFRQRLARHTGKHKDMEDSVSMALRALEILLKGTVKR